MSQAKVAVDSTSTYNSASLSNQITTALISSNSIPTIQSALLHELQSSGWTANLRAYVIKLMRSGDCTKYDDIMDRVLEEAMKGMGDKSAGAKSNGVNGNAKAGESLRIPESAIKEGVKVVRRELEKVCEVVD